MKFTPISEQEYNNRNVWPAGVYPCTILNCEEGKSKNTNDGYFKCKVQLYNTDGGTTNVFYYMMAEGKAAWQLRAGAETFGLLDKYDAGSIDAADFEMREGYATVGIQEETAEYPAKNIIKAFRKDAPKGVAAPVVKPAPKKAPVSAGSFDDLMDDIPL